MSSRIFRLLMACLVVPALSGCGAKPRRVIVLGLDGVDPDVVNLMMSENKLPHFARLRLEGASGRLRSSAPLLSPVIWTTIATGKEADKHRIGHFVAVNKVTGEQLPVTSQMRKVKAVWNIASEAEKKVGVIGWWATWPAETVNGAIVSDHLCYHFLFDDGFSGGPRDPTGKVFPPGLEDEIGPLVSRPRDITPEQAAEFISVSPEEFARPFSFQDELGHFKWALATAESYRRIGLHLWKTRKPDLMMVYIEGVDSTSHLFGHLFRAEGLAGEMARQQERYGRAVEQMYVYADRIVGDFMAVMDENTTLVVLSDHGFQLGKLPDDPSRTRDMRRVSERFHALHGILFLYGNRVKPSSRLVDPSILDITPTLLALLGQGPARDMPGRVLTEGLIRVQAPPGPVSYERTPGVEGAVARDPRVDSEMLEKFRSLGYLHVESPEGERNLAAVLFREGKYAEAVEAYRRLVEKAPEDGALRASLAGALGAMGRYDEALAQLSRAIELQPLNPEAYHNRAIIHERRQDRAAAIRDFLTALRYDPQFEPARRELQRLGINQGDLSPRTPAQKKAFRLANQAADAARRGDYPKAMHVLDEAERIAPGYALIFQYRSNVAYLMGDREAALEALKNGLALEPDNALFLENLKRLQRERR